ncbi:MAG: helix-turn-helix domain-containing protein [Deltaproteobacteria bacterium]|nr:helix-turn-helix domain-containing protein [Deltaproteobacteria bacterium]
MTLGEKLKKIRTAKAFSLGDLANETGLSRSFLSQVEKNKTSPSINSLFKITKALEINGAELFQKENDSNNFIVHEEEREFLQIKRDKLRIEFLTPRAANIKVDPVFIRFGPGGDTGFEPTGMHDIFTVILEGTLELTISEEVYVLRKGDSIYVDSTKKRRWRNIGKDDVLSFAVAIKPFA